MTNVGRTMLFYSQMKLVRVYYHHSSNECLAFLPTKGVARSA